VSSKTKAPSPAKGDVAPLGATVMASGRDAGSIGRVVLHRHVPATTAGARSALMATASAMAQASEKVTFLITPGGFVSIHPPEAIGGRRGWNAKAGDEEPLLRIAEQALEELLPDALRRRLATVTSVVTVGIDVRGSDDVHAEFIATVQLRGKHQPLVKWTGKSYPAVDQQRTLVPMLAFDTHCQVIGPERVVDTRMP
jgi:hypothetical protein